LSIPLGAGLLKRTAFALGVQMMLALDSAVNRCRRDLVNLVAVAVFRLNAERDWYVPE